MKIIKNGRSADIWAIASLASILASPLIFAQCAQADPFKLGVQDSTVVPNDQSGQYQYPSPQMVPVQRPMQGAVRSAPPMQAGTRENYSPPPQQRPPIQMQARVALPPGYLGVWNVQGNRKSVQAQPEFQAGAEQAFAPGTQNVWQISGNASSGYTMGNGQMSTQLVVDHVGADGTAFMRYQHQVGKTMAQEAIVMSLAPGGMQFSGLERISIVKPNNPQPRAKVTYELMGQRQR